MDIIIKGGDVYDNATGSFIKTSVCVRNGQIVELTPDAGTVQADITIDATGKYVLPGFIDLHAHLRDFEQGYKETIATGTKAAIHGGVTTVYAMPNTKPPLTSLNYFRDYVQRIKETAYCNVGLFCGYPVAGQEELQLLKDEGAFAVKIYMEKSLVGLDWASDNVLKEALQTCRKVGLPVFFHPGSVHNRDDDAREYHKMINGGAGALEAHSLIHSKERECEGIERMASIASTLDGADGNILHLHACHVSCKAGLEIIASWKREKTVHITCEATPHHLFLSWDMAFLKESYEKVLQPLRSAKERDSLLNSLKSGGIDIIASDHAPHTIKEKARRFLEAPAGFPVLDIYAPLVITRLTRAGFGFDEIVRLCCTEPAKICNLEQKKGKVKPKYDADIIVVKRVEPYAVDPYSFQSRSRMSPFQGKVNLEWKVNDVVVNGELQIESGFFVGKILKKMHHHKKVELA
ncbi:MAG: dihydroorotase [Promethearchaeota archaeon]